MGRPLSTVTARALLVGFGLALAALPEVGLRLAGLGGEPPLLRPLHVERDGEELSEVNPGVVSLFFEGAAATGSHRREVVAVPKPAGHRRVVLVGASTVEGFPLPRNLDASAFLERMLASTADDEVEVVNLGVTAIASLPVRIMAEKALDDLEPDLLVAYSGHNEFFGAAGVASQEFLGTRPTVVRLAYAARRSAVYQLARGWLALGRTETARPTRRHLIETMARVPRVPPGDPLRAAARRNLVANLRAIATSAVARGVPVVLCTLASLEEGMAPVASSPTLPPEVEEEVRRPLVDGSTDEDLRRLTALRERWPDHAGIAYRLAELHRDRGHAVTAEQLFRTARDLDAMPWRAPDEISDAVVGVAAEVGVSLADARRVFDEESPGANGWDLFYDHVHPSLRGQALLARTVFDVIRDRGLLPLRRDDPPVWTELALALGSHPLEEYLVAHKMHTLFESEPMADPLAAARFARAMDRIRAGLDGVGLDGLERWRRASARAGRALPISYFAGAAALSAGQLHRAGELFAAAEANALALSDEWSAAALLGQLAARRRGESGTLCGVLAEAERAAVVSSGPLLDTARSGLLLLAGEPERARAVAVGSAGPPTAREAAFAAELPDLAEIEDLARTLLATPICPDT